MGEEGQSTYGEKEEGRVQDDEERIQKERLKIREKQEQNTIPKKGEIK